MTPPISVIVRSKDRAHTIRDALVSVRAQEIPAELIVVDSGSTDGTVAIAREYADLVIEIPAAEFTFGGALNLGADAATAPVHVALSAHCALPDPGWFGRVLAHHADPAVAATTGIRLGPDGHVLTGPIRQAGDPLHDIDPYWGYSNHAGSWDAATRAAHPFTTELSACEDKEWAARVRRDGKVVVIDPALFVTAKHRRREGVPALYDRALREAEAVARVTGKKPLTLREAARNWVIHRKVDKPLLQELVNPYRAVEMAGRYVGERKA